WLRVQARALEGLDPQRAVARLRAHLADGPLRQRDLQGRLEAEGFPRLALITASMWVDLVRVPPSGTWDQRRADLYGLADDWLGRAGRPAEAQALRHLIRRYLGGFGPASLNDVAGWAGIPVSMLRPAAERLSLRRFRDEDGGKLLDLPRARLPDPDTPAPARFLPTWDATLLAHARRTRILPEPYRARVFDTKTPHSFPTFLVDGAVAGTWRYQGGRVRLEPFGPLPARARRDLEAEAKRLAAFHADDGAIRAAP
ncbi:MAG TPA: winged helix DNA-binding domain-containing protein, partial [Actinomycetota bacterium]|nr:winged helix DNA-binding domain-containing protein [Actinomycetota bacterium]